MLKNLNGWQRLWLLTSAFLFVLIIGFFDDRSDADKEFSKLFNLSAERSRELSKKAIEDRDDKVCIELLSNLEQIGNDYSKKYTLISDFKKTHSADNAPCGQIIAAIQTRGKIDSKQELIDAFERNNSERKMRWVFQFFKWILFCASLYGLGVLGRWVARGGFSKKS